MTFLSRVGLAGLALTHTSLLAQDAFSSLDESTVTATILPGQDSREAAQDRIRLNTGGASLTEPDDWTGRTVAPEEIFQFDPGVFARSRGVGNDTRISVRGSGIQRRFGDRGITLLLDGIPANDADGSFYFRGIDPFSISHIETYRGASSLPYGGNQLGGAVNIVQKNGLNTPGTHLQLEAGRHDTYRSHISHGGSNDIWDWFIGYSYAESDGYRERQDWRNHHVTGNLGYKWSKTALTRFYLLYSDSDAALSGSLSPTEFSENPRQTGANRTDVADRDLSTFRLGQRTEWETPDGKWSFYTNYQYLDFDHLINEGNFRFNRLIDYDSDDLQIGLHGEENGSFFGRKNTVRFNTRFNYGRQQENGFGGFVRPGTPASQIDRENTATNIQFYIENDLTFAPHHHLILGTGWQTSTRRTRIGAGDETGDPKINISDSEFTYRIGYLYEPDEQTQIFANVSQHIEASPFSEAGGALGPLDPQVAQTIEIGTRFGTDIFHGELTYFHSRIDDEFIFIETAPGRSETTNLDSIHVGIEAALSLDLSAILDQDSGPQLFFDNSYQWYNFEIDAGPQSGNTLPGVPEQVYSGRLRLEDRAGSWKISLSADWLPEGLTVDNANTLGTDAFVNWRIAGEVMVRDGVSLYAGVDNLFDEDFANTVTVNPTNDRFIDPGNGRSAYVGIKLAF